MPFLLRIAILCLLPGLASAQVSADQIERDVLNTMSNPKPMVAAMNTKTFQSGGNMGMRPAKISESSFKYQSKDISGSYKMSRSFLGIKNPWFGKATYDSKGAPLWSKSLFEGSSAKFASGTANTKAYTGAGFAANTANNASATKTKAASTEGTAQGAILSDRAKKEMSVEEVRELLNKNR